MIITRSPLRVSLGGGGTDLPSYYREHGGLLIVAAIDKYVYNAHGFAAFELSLPRHAFLEDEEVASVCDACNSWRP